MPRFTYKDWVGRKARCRRKLRNKAHTFFFKKGEIVTIVNYDRYLHFSIKKGKRFLWKIDRFDIELLEHPVDVLRESVLRFVLQNTLLPDTWISTADIAKGLGKTVSAVAGELVKLCSDGLLLRERGRAPRCGYGYRPTRHVIQQRTRYDWITSDQEFLAE